MTFLPTFGIAKAPQYLLLYTIYVYFPKNEKCYSQHKAFAALQAFQARQEQFMIYLLPTFEAELLGLP